VVVQTIVFRGLQTPMRRALLTWTECYWRDPERRSRGEDLSGSRDKYPSRGRVRSRLRMIISNVLVERRQERTQALHGETLQAILGESRHFGWLMPNNSAAFACDNPRRLMTPLIAIARRTLRLPFTGVRQSRGRRIRSPSWRTISR